MAGEKEGRVEQLLSFYEAIRQKEILLLQTLSKSLAVGVTSTQSCCPEKGLGPGASSPAPLRPFPRPREPRVTFAAPGGSCAAPAAAAAPGRGG